MLFIPHMVQPTSGYAKFHAGRWSNTELFKIQLSFGFAHCDPTLHSFSWRELLYTNPSNNP